MKHNEKNLSRDALEPCSFHPLKGFLRDGDSRMPLSDDGRYGAFAQATQAFLDFTACRGNDLTTSVPMTGFPGLKSGD